MDPQEFRSLADELRKRKEPAACRTAISRAYYYAFTSAVKFVGRYLPIPENAEAHGILPRFLKNSGNDDLRDVADTLDKLRTYRNEADYTLTADRPEKTPHAEMCFKMAVQVIVDLVEVIGNPSIWNAAVAETKRQEAEIKKQ